MAKIYVCDICGNKMSEFKNEQARIDIFPKIKMKNPSYNDFSNAFGTVGNKPYEITIECCEPCAEYVYNMIQTRKEISNHLHERNNNGSDATNTEE